MIYAKKDFKTWLILATNEQIRRRLDEERGNWSSGYGYYSLGEIDAMEEVLERRTKWMTE